MTFSVLLQHKVYKIGTTLFSKQECLRKIITCHGQSVRFYGQRHRTSDSSGNEILIEFKKNERS